MNATIEAPLRLATDVGGTFIDFVVLDPATGEITVDKEPAFRDEVAKRLLAGYERASSGTSVTRLIHGSTLAINTILQEVGSSVGLLTTRGFRDVLAIGRGNRPDIYDFFWEPARPLVPRRLRREIGGRLDHVGRELEPIDEAEVAAETRLLAKRGVEAVAICLLHSYANPDHEQKVRAHVLDACPDMFVTCSHEVATEWREYERTSSVVLNAYVDADRRHLLDGIESSLEERAFTAI